MHDTRLHEMLTQIEDDIKFLSSPSASEVDKAIAGYLTEILNKYKNEEE